MNPSLSEDQCKDPNLSPEEILRFSRAYPALAEQHPALPLISLEDPIFYEKILCRVQEGWIEKFYGIKVEHQRTNIFCGLLQKIFACYHDRVMYPELFRESMIWRMNRMPQSDLDPIRTSQQRAMDNKKGNELEQQYSLALGIIGSVYVRYELVAFWSTDEIIRSFASSVNDTEWNVPIAWVASLIRTHVLSTNPLEAK